LYQFAHPVSSINWVLGKRTTRRTALAGSGCVIRSSWSIGSTVRKPRLTPNRRTLQPNACFGSIAGIAARSRHVRFTPNSRHSSVQVECPLCATNGHRRWERARGECATRFHCRASPPNKSTRERLSLLPSPNTKKDPGDWTFRVFIRPPSGRDGGTPN
jgi:hypothetical protein